MYSRKKGEREGGRGKEEREDNAGGHVRVRTVLQLLETGRRNGIEKRKKKKQKKTFFFLLLGFFSARFANDNIQVY